MSKEYKDLFAFDKNLTLPEDLLSSVLERVRFEQKKSARRELIFVGGAAVGSFVGLIPAFSYFVSTFIASSFYQYTSVILSEGMGALTFWKEIVLSLAESLPIFSIVIFLAVLVVFLWSLARTTRDVKTGFLTA